MATLQVKGMDDTLYEALKRRAAGHNRSLSQEVVTLIQDALSRPAMSAREATQMLLDMAGTWPDDRPAEVIALEIRKSRRSGKRFNSRNVLD